MADKHRVAVVETTTIADPGDDSPARLIRYQFGNHLGSATLEIDDRSQIITYEEYYPHGNTSFQAANKSLKAATKRYRYTARERDAETGLYYHGARYSAPWRGPWISPDPKGLVDGTALYAYCANNPVLLHDPSGTQGQKPLPGLIANDAKGAGALWERAVVEPLGPRLNAT